MRRYGEFISSIFFAALVVVQIGAVPAGAVEHQSLLDACKPLSAGLTRNESLDVDRLHRSYAMHVPPHRGNAQLRIAFAFHGRGETPESFARYSGLSRLPIVVIYPRGLPGRGGKLSWSGTPTAAPGVDDVRFVRAILAGLRPSPCIDAQRVYATGKSDGGGFAARLGCVAADRFVAVVSVAGAYYPISGGCRPVRAVAILEIHGSGDRVVPYAGSARRSLPDIPAWLAAWAGRDGCPGRPVSRSVASAVRETRWPRCSSGTSVIGYRIVGGGHTWPGAVIGSGPGVTSHQIDATAVIEHFFLAAR